MSSSSISSILLTLQSCSFSSDSDDLPLPPIATMAELATTTVSQHPLPLPPQTVLADILVPEGDAASKLPNNHKSRGMNENFQASLTDYTSDFSGVLHYNENFE
ncbi:hypothetical protein F5051DRAFT_442549 [Lentinula edodes]|nr:hypothetical protein F5051DRAFT_442549 [Lentinula edodes]KAJ3889823.1 hypothetical protein GG344DRAFT_78406 [Lentinula edodes]